MTTSLAIRPPDEPRPDDLRPESTPAGDPVPVQPDPTVPDPTVPTLAAPVPAQPPPQPTDHAVIIGGMHRSGTSLLASLFEGAGVAVGERLMGSGNGNDVGHFEDLDFQQFHERALVGNGLPTEGFTADGLPVVPTSLWGDARKLVAARRGRGGVWGWKDPRTILFLDFWDELLPDARYVFIFRRPWEVVDSFFRRGDPAFVFNPLLAARVWLHYNRLLLRFVARHPQQCIVREMTQVIADPGAVFAAVREQLHVSVGEPPARFRPELLGSDAEDGPRARLLEAVCPESIDVYRRLREEAGSTSPWPVDAGLSAAEVGIMEWARAARLDRECGEARRESVRIRQAATAEMTELRQRLSGWRSMAADIHTLLDHTPAAGETRASHERPAGGGDDSPRARAA